MVGVPMDPSESITLMAYMLNLISYLPADCMDTDVVFASYEDSILLVSNDA